MFRLRPSSKDKDLSVNLYRQCMRVIKQLEPNHQKIWYDYTRLKFEEQEKCNGKQVKKLVSDALEELEWVKSVLARKNGDMK
jgi:hypothetical protein